MTVSSFVASFNGSQRTLLRNTVLEGILKVGCSCRTYVTSVLCIGALRRGEKARQATEAVKIALEAKRVRILSCCNTAAERRQLIALSAIS